MAALARAGAAEGLWLRADRQTGGKGRQGRSWISPPGNLYASTLVRLHLGDPAAPTLALVAAVALDQVASAYAGAERLMIKWPNDLVASCIPAQAGVQAGGGTGPQPAPGYGKIAGILLEREGDAVVIGFGVNLAHHPDIPERPATSFAALAVSAPAPDLFLADLAESFAYWLGRWRGEGLEPVRRRWLERAHPIGTPLAAQGADGQVIEGLFEGLDESGALRLRLADGSAHVMHAGDVFLI